MYVLNFVWPRNNVLGQSTMLSENMPSANSGSLFMVVFPTAFHCSIHSFGISSPLYLPALLLTALENPLLVNRPGSPSPLPPQFLLDPSTVYDCAKTIDSASCTLGLHALPLLASSTHSRYSSSYNLSVTVPFSGSSNLIRSGSITLPEWTAILIENFQSFRTPKNPYGEKLPQTSKESSWLIFDGIQISGFQQFSKISKKMASPEALKKCIWKIKIINNFLGKTIFQNIWNDFFSNHMSLLIFLPNIFHRFFFIASLFFWRQSLKNC